jgi:hypothetical protein
VGILDLIEHQQQRCNRVDGEPFEQVVLVLLSRQIQFEHDPLVIASVRQTVKLRAGNTFDAYPGRCQGLGQAAEAGVVPLRVNIGGEYGYRALLLQRGLRRMQPENTPGLFQRRRLFFTPSS